MSWGKVYETTNFGELLSYIHLGFNKALTTAISLLVDNVNVLIDSITHRITT